MTLLGKIFDYIKRCQTKGKMDFTNEKTNGSNDRENRISLFLITDFCLNSTRWICDNSRVSKKNMIRLY